MNFISLKQASIDNPKAIFMFTIGGCGEFGMNMTAYAYRGQLLVVDCGLMFAEPYEIGIDAKIPSYEQLQEVFGGTPDAILITHGHEDHIGALPFFLPQWDCPVHIGPWALELVKDKLRQRGDDYSYRFHTVQAGSTSIISDLIKVSWLHVPHSIPHCSALLIACGSDLNIFHTGDFKVQGYQPFENNLDLQQLKAIGKKSGITALVADSTNALNRGSCPSEQTTILPLRKILEEAPNATFLTTFSSNLWRIKTILLLASELGRRVLVIGAGMKKVLELGTRLGLLGEETRVIASEDDIRSINRNKLIILISGCQGEYRSGMHRLVNDEINSIDIRPQDRVIFSSRSIPGNEKSIAKMASMCRLKGAQVFTVKESPEIHVSGHAYEQDLLDLLENLEPKFYIPVHGTFTQIMGNQELVEPSRCVPVTNGNVYSIDNDSWSLVAEYNLEPLFVDSWSRQTMDFETMRSRHKIGDSGLAIATGHISQRANSISIDFVGLPFQSSQDQSKFADSMLKKILLIYENAHLAPGFNPSEFNEQCRLSIRKALADRFIKKPVVYSRITIEESLV